MRQKVEFSSSQLQYNYISKLEQEEIELMILQV